MLSFILTIIHLSTNDNHPTINLTNQLLDSNNFDFNSTKSILTLKPLSIVHFTNEEYLIHLMQFRIFVM